MRNVFFLLFIVLISCNYNSQKISKDEIDFLEKDNETGFFRGQNKKGKYGFVDKDSIVKIPFVYDFINPFDENLLAYTKNEGKEFYINKEGKVIIPPEYGKLNLFSEGLLSVKKNGKYGFLDKSGKLVIPFSYDGTGFFSQGLCVVSKGGKYGLINKVGEIVIPIVYESVKNSDADNIVIALQKGKWAFFNSEGKQLSDFIYDNVFSGYNLNIKPPSNLSAVTTYFKNGAVLVLRDNKYEFLNEKLKPAFSNNKFDSATVFDTYQNAIVKNDGKYGMVRSSGVFKVPLNFDSVEYFDNNHLSSEYYNAKKGNVYHIFNRELNEIGQSFEPIYNDFSIETSTLIFRNLEHKYGMVNSRGEILISFDYDHLSKIEKSSLLYVKKDDRYGIISAKGEIKIPVIYKELMPIYDKFDDIEKLKKLLFIADGTVVDIDNRIIINKYDSIVPIFYNHNNLIVSKNKKLGIINIDKKILLPLEYDEISNWVEYGPGKKHFIKKNGKFGLIENETFKIIIPPVYDKFFHAQGLIFASKNGKAGILNTNNKELCTFIFDEVKPHKYFGYYDNQYRKFYAKKAKSFYLIALDGKILQEISEKEYIENTEHQNM